MGSLNSVHLIGRLGKDPESRQSNNGTTVTSLTLATSDRYKDKSGEWQEKTEWHNLVSFGNRADAMARYLKKGSQVYIEGGLQTRSWDDKDGVKRYTTEIVVHDFQFLDSKASNHTEGEQQDSSGYTAPAVEDSDSIPF